jgi:VWFA-related protein
MREARLGVVVGVALLVAGAGFAQVSPLKETITVHLVEVPVTVVDRDGNPVRNLKKENFEIYDQGKKQPMTSFDVVDFASPELMKATSPLNPVARRSFLLLFDVSFTSPLGRTKAEQAAMDFIARGMSTRDLAAVGTIDVDRGFRLATSFTTDRTLLAASIREPQNLVSSDPLQIAGASVLTDNLNLSDGTGGTQTTNNRGDNEMTTMLRELGKQETRMTDSRNRARAENQIQMLATIAQTLRRLPGRKQIILFSEGFDPKLIQGHSIGNDAQGEWEARSITSGQIWNIDNDQRYGSTSSLKLLDRMSTFFRGSDVVLNAIDTQGVRVQNDITTGSVENNSLESLHILTAPTGGEVFKNSNDMNADLARMLHRQEVVYVLSFNASTTYNGKFHDLKVKLTGVPGGARAFHRLGYYEAGGESGLERRLTNAEVVLNDIPQSDLRLATLAAAFPAPGGFAQVPVVLEIDGSDLAREAGDKPVTAEIYIYAFDDEGIVRDRVFQRLNIDPAKVGDRLKAGGVKYVATLRLPDSGHYAIRSLVRLPGSDKKGFSRSDLSVPRGDEVAVLPPLFMDDPERWLMVRGPSHFDKYPYPFHIDGEPFVPSAAPTVRSGQSRRFAVFIYNATADEMQYETDVLDDKGVQRANAASLVRELQGDDVTKLLFQYAPLPADMGDSTLDVTVKKKGSAEARTSHIPIIVQR